VDERLWCVATDLPLGDVVLLGEQAGRAARGPVALEPAGRLDLPARPNPARGSKNTRTWVSPSMARTRRSATAVCGSPGMLSASRHSISWSVVTHRLRQIKVPGS